MSRVVVSFLLIMVPALVWPAGRVLFEGAESGNLDAWSAENIAGDLYRDKCTSVTSAFDGGLGPRTGSRMISCNANGQVEWNAPAAFEAMVRPLSYTREFFIRAWYRRDSDHWMESPGGSTRKLFRIDAPDPFMSEVYFTQQVDAMSAFPTIGGIQKPTYWGSVDIYQTAAWGELELYVRTESSAGAGDGMMRIWMNGTLVVNHENVNYGIAANGKLDTWHFNSNWSDCHTFSGGACDALNHYYADDVELFTDLGSGATGSMVDGTIQDGGGGDTTPPVISNPLPSGTQAIGTTNVTLQVTTNENSTCKYGSSDAAYASLPSTFSTTGGTTHQQALAVSAGSYTRYVRCQDGSGNANTSSTVITFTIPVLAPPTNFNVTVQ